MELILMVLQSIQIAMLGVPSVARIQNSYNFDTQSEVSSSKKEDHDKQKNYYGCLENGQITQFYFKKLQQQQIALSLITIINLYLIVFSVNNHVTQANISFPELKEQSLPTINLSLYFISISSVIAMALIALRTQTMLQLEKEQKLVFEKAGLVSSKKILYLLLEWIIVLVQPYPFLINSKFQTQNQEVGYSIEYPANDLLTILAFGRIYIILRTILILTPYMNNRSNRLCKMYGCRADYLYSIKCLFKDHPLKLICLFYFSSAAIFAYLIYIAERQMLMKATPQDRFSLCTDYHNAFWLVLITTTTVGYGDYYPQTVLSRVIILFVAIWGTLIVSIMVVVVSNTLSMEKTQLRTSKILNKLELRQELEDKASKVIGYLLLSCSSKHKGQRKQNITKLLNAKKTFAESRKAIRQMAQVNDLEDEIASHFLKLNGDIETLNENQDKIIDFIHKNFNAERQSCIPEQCENYEDSEEEELQRQPPKFMKLFKNQLKQKLA